MSTSRRKNISLLAQLHAALYQLGLDPKNADLDHSPPLALREWDEAAQDTIPPASDPKHLVWMSRAAHKAKTNGPSRATSAGGDIHAIAKVKRLTGETPKPKSRKIQSAGFQTKKKPAGRSQRVKSRWK